MNSHVEREREREIDKKFNKKLLSIWGSKVERLRMKAF